MLRVYEIIEVKSRGSCHVKFQGHGMVILPGLRPAAVDAARNKQLDCNDCFVAITSDFEISRFTPQFPSRLSRSPVGAYCGS